MEAILTVKEGDRLPDAAFVVMGSNGPELKYARDIFDDQTVALFGFPGAYTPVCEDQLPGIIALRCLLKQQGIDTVACTAVNDVFVLERWASDHGAQGSILMLADGNAAFAMRSGLALDLTRYGLGMRSNRYAMVVKRGRVTLLAIEDEFTNHQKTSAASLCAQLGHVK
jgi:peroxiredoxin